MGFLHRILGLRRHAVRAELQSLYVDMLHSQLEMPLSEAQRTVRDVLRACEQQGQSEGTAELSGEFGRLLLAQAEAGNPSASGIVATARREGARDEDIEEWWSLADIQRRMVVWSEAVFRLASFKAYVDEGLSPEEAMSRVREAFPMYGDPDELEHVSGDDRLLPHELRGRVDDYRAAHGAHVVSEASAAFTTYNAFVRGEIRIGRL